MRPLLYACARGVALSLIATSLLFVPTIGAACDCRTESQPDAFARSAVVFEAVVISVGPSRFAGQPCGGFCPDTEARVRVTRRWKGTLAREVTIYTDLGTDCGITFQVGERYVVYAGDAGTDAYVTDACTRTALVSASEDLTALGRGTRVRR